MLVSSSTLNITSLSQSPLLLLPHYNFADSDIVLAREYTITIIYSFEDGKVGTLLFFSAILLILIRKLFISYLQIGPFYLLISGTHLNQYKKIFSEFLTQKIISQKFDIVFFFFKFDEKKYRHCLVVWYSLSS